jgi:hypothetical protein
MGVASSTPNPTDRINFVSLTQPWLDVAPGAAESGTRRQEPARKTSWLWLPVMVGARGFEPPASPTPKVRATPAPRPDDICVIILYAFRLRFQPRGAGF